MLIIGLLITCKVMLFQKLPSDSEELDSVDRNFRFSPTLLVIDKIINIPIATPAAIRSLGPTDWVKAITRKPTTYTTIVSFL